MGDLGERPVGGVVAQLHPVAVTISDRSERQRHLPSAVDREREVENVARRRVGHRIGTGGVTGQRQPWALRRQHRRTRCGMGVGEQHPVRRGITHALLVDLQAEVQCRTPRPAEPAPRPIRRQVGPLQRPGQQAGQLDVDLRENHLPARHVHRVDLQHPRRGGLGELIAGLEGLPDPAGRPQTVGGRRAYLPQRRTTHGAQPCADQPQPLPAAHPPTHRHRGPPQPRHADDTAPTRNQTQRVQAELP